MTLATVIKLAKEGSKIWDKIQENENSSYALLADVTYPPIKCAKFFKPFAYTDEVISILPTDDEHVLVTIHAFDGKQKIWNGPSIVGNIDDGLMLASLPHDVLYDRMEIIEKCTGIKQDNLREFADVLLANLMEKYGSGKVKSRLAYTAVKIFGGLYHWMKELLLAIVLFVVASSCSSCQYPTILEDEPPVPKYEKVAQMSPKGCIQIIPYKGGLK